MNLRGSRSNPSALSLSSFNKDCSLSIQSISIRQTPAKHIKEEQMRMNQMNCIVTYPLSTTLGEPSYISVFVSTTMRAITERTLLMVVGTVHKCPKITTIHSISTHITFNNVCPWGMWDGLTPSKRTLVMENRGTMLMSSSSATKASSSGVRLGWRVLGRAMASVSHRYGCRCSAAVVVDVNINVNRIQTKCVDLLTESNLRVKVHCRWIVRFDHPPLLCITQTTIARQANGDRSIEGPQRDRDVSVIIDLTKRHESRETRPSISLSTRRLDARLFDNDQRDILSYQSQSHRILKCALRSSLHNFPTMLREVKLKGDDMPRLKARLAMLSSEQKSDQRLVLTSLILC